ncbi:CLIP domain-containing serine protease HP8-like [Nomia melanderi]|uniref:CLIP domain-containing serine protease HP8-like n=1 Tax=Nomia melanderi TaxID=2448451 RepID=UPI0013040014|nr:CLIP domain-containing serine protease 2-like [Nomia melanderi]
MAKLLVLSAVLQALLLYPANAQNAGSSCTTPNGAPGTCIGIRQCVPLLNILQMRPLPSEAINFLRQSQCGFAGSNPEVCCPNQGPDVSTPSRGDGTQVPDGSGNQTPTGNEGNENVQYDLSNNPLLPADCGKDLSQRIVGGDRTDIDEFPWMALLEYSNPTSRRTACGGVLISKRYVLTAAHCVSSGDLPNNWRLENVRLGEYDTSTSTDCIWDGDVMTVCADDPITVSVEEQIAHESYRPRSKERKFDIALLRLSRDVLFTDYVKPICLPTTAEIGPKLHAAGWGKTENTSSSNIKLKVSLPLSDREACQVNYGNAGIVLSPNQFCAGGERGKDTCQGDSGGPLMYRKRNRSGNAKWSVVGVVSFGPSPCGTPGWAAVYTKVIDFMPWILSKMRP